MVRSELSPFSLPLRFSLLPSLAHPTTPCACLTVQLPLRHPGAPAHQPNQPSFTVTRILDPEHKEPWVSLGPILVASGLTTLEGLLLFGLRKPAYDLSLGGVAPFTEIWVTLKLARSCASRLDRLDELDGLLEWRSRSAWTVEDKEEGGLVSNWKIGSDRVDPAQYSTAAMLSTTFLRVHILPSGTQVRTFVPPEFAQAAPSATPAPFLAPGFKDLHRRLVEWTTREWEDWLEGDEEDEYGRRTASGAPTNGAEPDLAGASFFSAGLSLLGLINGLPPDAFGHAPPGSAVLIAPADRFPEKPSTAALTGSDLLRISSPPLGLVEVPTELELGRHELLAGSAKARLALVDFMSRLTAREWTRSLEAELAGPSEVAVVAAAAAVEAFSLSGGVSAEAFEALAARVEALESAVVVQALEQASAPPKIPAERGIDPAEALREENTMLRLRVREMEEARAAKVGVTQAKRPELMAHVPVIVVLAGAVWWWHRSHGT